jgi:hypothetical protein
MSSGHTSRYHCTMMELRLIVEPAPTTAAIERLLVWTVRELRAESVFAWYCSRRPLAIILACPPGPN